MNQIKRKIVIKVVGMLTLIEGLALLPCSAVSYFMDEPREYISISATCLIYIVLGWFLLRTLRHYKLTLRVYEGYFIATLCWVYCSVMGAVPFFVSGNGYSIIQSIFEATAGFTTTGCTVMDLDAMPRGLIMWRAVSNWLGGMGILVLVASVLPALGIGGQSMAMTETTGPSLEKVGGKFSSTGQFLYVTYSFFSIVEFILLALGPLSVFDAFVNTCSSISTGGLLVTAENAASFTTVYVRTVIIIFTLLSSMNYILYYHMISGRRNALYDNVEVRGFWLIIIIATLLITFDLLHEKIYTNAALAFKDSISQVISFISTSGYYVCDYSQWPAFTTVVLFTLLIIGGCSMSTSGSLKVIRIIVFFKMIQRSIFRQIHPNSVKAIKIGGKAVPADKAAEITAHILLYFLVLFFSFLVIGLNNFDMTTTITSVIGAFTNTGLALGGPGCTGYYGMFSEFSELYFAFLMIVGRLEMFAVIILFTKSFRNINKAEQL